MTHDHAILLLTTLKCYHDTEGNGDDIYINIYRDGVFWKRFGNWNMQSGESDSLDIEIECTYLNEIRIQVMEDDGGGSKDDHVGDFTITRSYSFDNKNEASERMTPGNGKDYEIFFRLIKDPIATVRVLGIYCETQSAGMNVDLANAIADVASTACDAAAKIIDTSPRPSRKVMSNAFEAASKVIQGIEAFAEFMAGLIEGDDDVYMKHVAQSKGYDGSFFPEEGNYYKMSEGDMVIFEEKYGEYFRFPLDRGAVTIELKEYDAIKYHCIVGSLIIDPANISQGSSSGISGGSPPEAGVTPIEGGKAVMDGPAVVEVANSYYGRHGGEGAVYYICYSVGIEDWCLPASTVGQNAIDTSLYYSLKNKKSGHVWNVKDGNSSDGTPINQMPEVNSNIQLFKFVDNGNGTWNIQAKHTGKNTRPGDGESAPVMLGSGGGNYTMEKQTDGYYRIWFKDAPLTPYGQSNNQGTDIVKGNPDGTGDSFYWKLKPYIDPSKWYRIRNQKSGMNWDVTGHNASSGAVIQQSHDNNELNQKFNFKPTGSGGYHIISRQNESLYIKPEGGAGSEILQHNNAAVFTLESHENGYYRILHNGCPVKVYNGSLENLEELCLGNSGEAGPECLWRFEERPYEIE